MTHTKKLEVRISGELVGYLAETPDHVIAFQYADAWIRNGFSKACPHADKGQRF
ncbi:MAG: HipA N-terminal domain-containing protein [Lachnospiraceae bacterium]|nr:HipA N-terminal domain-containing protein [Lachnospiraceae bacterium]